VAAKKLAVQLSLPRVVVLRTPMRLRVLQRTCRYPQLQQSMQNGSLPKYVGMPILENKVNEAERMKMAQTMMGSEQQGQPQSISDALMQRASTVNVAGGGIIAFEAGGLITPRILQEALNKVNAARNPQEKQAAQNAYNQLLKAYQTQTSSASDTGAGIGDVRPEGGIAPSTEPAPVKAAPVEPQSIKMDPEPKPEGITSIVEPTRQEEVEQYLKERAAIMGDDEYAKGLKARAEKEPSFFEKLIPASTQIGLAGSMIRDPSKFDVYAQQAADLQEKQQKSADQRELAVLEAQKAERDTKGKVLDVIEGRREKRAEAQFDRQSKVLAASIAARKPTDLKYYAEMTLKASQGDEEAKIIVAGINDYLQQSAIGRNIVAQQQADIAGEKLNVELYDKSVTFADNAVNKLRSPENTAYKDLQKQDRANKENGNPTTLAQDYKDELAQIYRNKAEGKNPKRSQPGAAPQGAGGKESPLPMPKTAAEAVDGKVYMTAKGPARWSAKDKVFVPVQ
jgi:hypothetical protein